MNSKDRKKAVKIIEEVLDLTDDNYLQCRVDRPVQEIFAHFEFDRNAPFSHLYFMEVIADFVSQIYLHCPGTTRNLPRSQACAEALTILERAYGSHDAPGYDAAIAHALNGIEAVLSRIAEFIIARTRGRHIRWVYSSRIDPFDWLTCCLIAEILIERYGLFLPPTLLSCTPARFADALPQLFKAVRSTESIVRKTMGADTESYPFSEMGDPILPLSQSEGPDDTVFT